MDSIAEHLHLHLLALMKLIFVVVDHILQYSLILVLEILILIIGNLLVEIHHLLLVPAHIVLHIQVMDHIQ